MSNKVLDYKELIVWKKSIILVDNIYTITKKFPKEELFGLSSQMRRSATSIPSNIAEGNKRSTKKDYANFITIALGSSAELETQLIIANRQKYISQDTYDKLMNLLTEIIKMLHTINTKLRK